MVQCLDLRVHTCLAECDLHLSDFDLFISLPLSALARIACLFPFSLSDAH